MLISIASARDFTCCASFVDGELVGGGDVVGAVRARVDHGHDEDGEVDPHHVVLDLAPEDHEAERAQGARRDPGQETHF